MSGSDDEDLRLFEKLTLHEFYKELFPKLKELSEILKRYLNYFDKIWKPNIPICFSNLEALINQCLKVKEDMRFTKKTSSSITLVSAASLIGWGAATLFLPPLGMVGTVVSGVGMASGLSGTAAHILSSFYERKSDKIIIEKFDETLKKHMENKKNLNDIMVEFETKFNSLLNYFDILGLNDDVLKSYEGPADCEMLKGLKDHSEARYYNSKADSKQLLEYKIIYVKTIKVLTGYIKYIFKYLMERAKSHCEELNLLLCGIELPPSVVGFLDDGANALGIASKVGLRLGIAFNMIGLGFSFYDIYTQHFKDCTQDQLIIKLKSIHKVLESEVRIFIDHQKEIEECENKINEMTEYV